LTTEKILEKAIDPGGRGNKPERRGTTGCGPREARGGKTSHKSGNLFSASPVQAMTIPLLRHSRESGNPVRDFQTEGPPIQRMRRCAPECTRWIPAFAGMTEIYERMTEIYRRMTGIRGRLIQKHPRHGGRGNNPKRRETAEGGPREARGGGAAQKQNLYFSPCFSVLSVIKKIFAAPAVVNAFRSFFPSRAPCSPDSAGQRNGGLLLSFARSGTEAVKGKCLSPRPSWPKRFSRRQAGLTLIELIVFIVVISVGLMGILAAYNTVVRQSADPLIRKQALSIAESLLLEIEQQPFTWCDTHDDNVDTATTGVVGAPGGCATTSQNLLPSGGNHCFSGQSPASESRGDNVNPFDNVSDYAGYCGPASDIVGTPQPALANYTMSVAITYAGGVAPFAGCSTDAVLRIEVTVAGGGETVTLVGYRARYAPNAA
jgi:MSHA pilin protein MshD